MMDDGMVRLTYGRAGLQVMFESFVKGFEYRRVVVALPKVPVFPVPIQCLDEKTKKRDIKDENRA
jgi:hypothetical protein